MFKSFKNILTKEEQHYIENNVVKSNRWQFSGISNSFKKDQLEFGFWSMELTNEDFFSNFFYRKILALIGEDLNLVRIHANGQTYGQPGNIHIDSSDANAFTFLYYSNLTWNPKWGGETVFIEEDSVFLNPYISNTGVFFSSNIPHFGTEPTRHCVDLRTTIAFKFKKNEYIYNN